MVDIARKLAEGLVVLIGDMLGEIGTDTNGNYGHGGVKGQLGGSAPGGGLGAIGVRASAPDAVKAEAVQSYQDRVAAAQAQGKERREREAKEKWQGGKVLYDMDQEKAEIMVQTGTQTWQPKPGVTRDQMVRWGARNDAVKAAEKTEYKTGETVAHFYIKAINQDGYSDFKSTGKWGQVDLTNPKTGEI